MRPGARRRHGALLAAALVAGGAAAAHRAARVSGELPDSWYRRGQEEWRAGQLAEAARSYQRAIALDPLDGRPYIGLAVLYEAVNRPDLAVAELKLLRRVNPEAPHLRCRLAEAYLGAEDVSEARTLAERAVRFEPDCARAFSVYGITLVRSRYSASAVTALRRALSLAPSDTGIAEVLVEAYAQQGDYAEAIRVGEPLLAAHGSARLEYHVGLAYSRLPATERHVTAAERHLSQAARLAPGWFQPSAELGRMYRTLGRRTEAIWAFETAWKRDGSVPGVAFNLAGLYRQAGDPRAAAMERRVADLAKGGESVTGLRVRYNQQNPTPKAIVQLARVEANGGETTAALHRLRKLLELDPANLEALRLYRDLDRSSRRTAPAYPNPGAF